MIKKILCLFAAGAFSACAHPGSAGRFEQTHGPGPLEKVAFYGRHDVDAATVQKYVLYRCAEIAKEKNKQHFLIFDSLAAAARKMPSELPAAATLGPRSIAFAFVLVQDESRFGSRETGKVLEELEPVVKRKRTGAQ